MTDIKILEIQIESDLKVLEDDINAGLYNQGDLEEFLERKRQLDQKIGRFEEMVNFEREQKLADLTEENQ